MVLFKEKPNDALQTWIVQRNDKRMFSKSFFKIQKKNQTGPNKFFFRFSTNFPCFKIKFNWMFLSDPSFTVETCIDVNKKQ